MAEQATVPMVSEASEAPERIARQLEQKDMTVLPSLEGAKGSHALPMVTGRHSTFAALAAVRAWANQTGEAA